MNNIESQIERFRTGFPWMKIVAPATPERGITVLSDAELHKAETYVPVFPVAGKCKFVPASGAASRMFKDVFAGLDQLKAGNDVAPDSAVAKMAASIDRFAFYTEELFGKKEDTPEFRLRVATKVLTREGLGYGEKPKGVIRFHRYPDGECRTAFAEHLVEGQEYMRDGDGSVNLTVTISPDHLGLFQAALAEVKDAYEKRYGVSYNVRFTYQDPATDTVAVDPDNNLFLKEDGTPLRRPAGHGALIYNLNEVEEELVSIKNIDNVSNERFLPVIAEYKKALMGKCLMLRDRIFSYLNTFDMVSDPEDPFCVQLCDEVEAFLSKELCVELPQTGDPKARMEAVRSRLDRPVRVCGMVRNQGEPGGGPFIIAENDGSTSLQILEGTQINMDDPQAAGALASATHFNPVDIVCCIRNYKGDKFDLTKYVDDNAGFISSKSYQGRPLKALELPGLWNGSMSDWNTAFVEVPLATFNPVKVAGDLLRPAHQDA